MLLAACKSGAERIDNCGWVTKVLPIYVMEADLLTAGTERRILKANMAYETNCITLAEKVRNQPVSRQ